MKFYVFRGRGGSMKFYVFRLTETFHRHIAIPAIGPGVARSILDNMSPEVFDEIDGDFIEEETTLVGEFDWEEEEK